MPQPKVSVSWKVFGLLLQVFAGVLLMYLSIAIVLAVLKNPVGQATIVALVLFIALGWALWAMLPDWLRKIIRWAITRKDRHHEN